MVKQQPKTIQDFMREQQLKDIQREKRYYRYKQWWTIFKRLTLIGLIGYYGSKAENRDKLTSLLKSASAPITQKATELTEGIKFFKDTLTPQNKQQSEEFHQRRKKIIDDLCKEGMQNPNFKYVERGTKEAREEMEYYRKQGMFKE